MVVKKVTYKTDFTKLIFFSHTNKVFQAKRTLIKLIGIR